MLSFIYQLLVVSIGLYIIIHLPQKLRNYRFARARGCKPPGMTWDIFGIHRCYELFAFALTDAIPLYGENLFSRHGRYTVPVVDLGRPGIVTMEPKNVQYMLSNLKEYGLSSARDHFHYIIGPSGIFTADGEAWQQSRALVRPSFTKTQIADFDSLEEHIRELFVTMDQLTDQEGVVAMKPLFNDLTMDFASELLFGRTAHALRQRREGKSEEGLAYAFDRGMLHATYSWILGRLHWLWRPAEYTRCRKTVHKYVDRFIAEALEKRQEGESEKERVLREGGRYVFLNALTGINQDPEMLRAQVLSIMLAGRDTTAALVSWIVWVLARENGMWERLQQEVNANLGVGAESRLPTWQELKDMKYLQAIIHEALRFYPPVPWSNRVALCDTILPVGGGPDQSSPVFVPKGAAVSYSLFSMHRRKDLWGDDADTFLPDRWLREDTGKKLREIGWGHIPFSGGPRICPGQQLALTEASYVVVRLCQRYRSLEKARDESDIPTWHSNAVSPPGDDVRVRMEKH